MEKDSLYVALCTLTIKWMPATCGSEAFSLLYQVGMAVPRSSLIYSITEADLSTAWLQTGRLK